MAELDKIRWRSRRGLPELDLLLEIFNRQHLDGLAPQHLQCLQELLKLSDNDLLDVVMERVAFPHRNCRYVLQLLRPA